jgi:hypothetical protein
VFVVSDVAGGTEEATDVLPDGTATCGGDRGHTRIAIKVASGQDGEQQRREPDPARQGGSPGLGQLLLIAHVVGAAHQAFAPRSSEAGLRYCTDRRYR